MKHVLILGILCLLSFSQVFAATVATPKNHIVIVENDWPPYFLGNDSKATGFAKDLLSICVPKTGYKAVFQFFPVKRMYSFLKKGEIDVALFSYKKEREDMVQYGKVPLFTSSYRPIVRSDSGFKINAIQDFDGLRLGHLAGLRYSSDFLNYVEKRKAAGDIVTTSVGESNLRMLLENIIDVFVDTKDTVLWRAHKLNVKDNITVLNFDIKTSEYFVTVSRNSPRITSPDKFLESIDHCVSTLKSSGRFEEISKIYGIHD